MKCRLYDLFHDDGNAFLRKRVMRINEQVFNDLIKVGFDI
jgi:hypothetical protein